MAEPNEQQTSGNVQSGQTGETTGAGLSQAIVDAVSAAVQTSVGSLVDRLTALENELKRGTVDDDVNNVQVGIGDPNERAARMSNSRDRTDFYRDGLMALTNQFFAMMNAQTIRYMEDFGRRAGDRYSASAPTPPGSKAA
jgi:hypothetical protein